MRGENAPLIMLRDTGRIGGTLMARMVADIPFVTSLHISPVTELNDLTKPPVTRYWLRSGTFDLHLDRAEAEQLRRELECILGDRNAHAESRCVHFIGD
jgi:hypothetical protein